MKTIATTITAVATATIALIGVAPAYADTAAPFDEVTTTTHSEGDIYHITPSDYGRTMGADVLSSVLSSEPSNDILHAMLNFGIPQRDNIYSQIACHAIFAPTKPQWNIETWRETMPNLSSMVESRCNPR